jgi:hypothetical protein
MTDSVKNYVLYTLTNTMSNWHESRENELKVEDMCDELRNKMKSYVTDEVHRVYLHIAYCDFSLGKKKPSIKISYSIKEKRIGVTCFLDYKVFRGVDSLDSSMFVTFHEVVRLDAIIAASKKYKIPEKNYKELLERRSKLGQIPEWIPEMEENPQLVVDMYKASVPG